MSDKLEYRDGQITVRDDGLFDASYLYRLGEPPYQALAGQGYGFATIEAARAAIDAAIERMESPTLELWRDNEPDCYHGWQATRLSIAKCPALRELAPYRPGNGYVVSQSVAEALGSVGNDGRIRFTEADVMRVAALVAEYQAQQAAKRAADPDEQLVRCDCGHTVPRILRMSASLGTSCPDCYDRMSDGE